MSRRVSVVVEILERYSELSDPVRSGNGNGAGGVLLMPHESHCVISRSNPPRCSCAFRSVGEVERLLRKMRDSEETWNLWWQVNAWWITASQVMLEPSPRRNGHRHKLVKLQLDEFGRVVPVRVHRRVKGADERQALEGAAWIAERWNLRDNGILVEPMLPLLRDGVAV